MPDAIKKLDKKMKNLNSLMKLEAMEYKTLSKRLLNSKAKETLLNNDLNRIMLSSEQVNQFSIGMGSNQKFNPELHFSRQGYYQKLCSERKTMNEQIDENKEKITMNLLSIAHSRQKSKILSEAKIGHLSLKKEIIDKKIDAQLIELAHQRMIVND